MFDRYFEDSLKATTHDKRGKGTRRRVTPQAKVPGNWNDFLNDNFHKAELNVYLAETLVVMTYEPEKQLYVTKNEKVLSNCDIVMDDCDHEESDTQLVVHCKNALSHGINLIKVMSIDTDVIVIFLGAFFKLRATHSITDIIIEYGQKEVKRLSLTSLASSLW